MVTAERIAAGASAYLDREILPHLPMVKAIILGSAAELYLRRLPEVVKQIPASMHLVDDSGMIDLDAICDAVKARMREPVPVDLPLVGRLTIDQVEVDKLRRYITEPY